VKALHLISTADTISCNISTIEDQAYPKVKQGFKLASWRFSKFRGFQVIYWYQTGSCCCCQKACG